MSTPLAATGRQITLGEAMAAVRMASNERLAPARAVSVDDCVALVMDIPTCATCGYSRSAHERSLRPVTCGRFSRG